MTIIGNKRVGSVRMKCQTHVVVIVCAPLSFQGLPYGGYFNENKASVSEVIVTRIL
jgi:hypothetical protein